MKKSSTPQQWVRTNEKTKQSYLYTKTGNSIKGEPITSEEAAQWVAENEF
jgi:hypothetical protein